MPKYKPPAISPLTNKMIILAYEANEALDFTNPSNIVVNAGIETIIAIAPTINGNLAISIIFSTIDCDFNTGSFV